MIFLRKFIISFLSTVPISGENLSLSFLEDLYLHLFSQCAPTYTELHEHTHPFTVLFPSPIILVYYTYLYDQVIDLFSSLQVEFISLGGINIHGTSITTSLNNKNPVTYFHTSLIPNLFQFI